MLNTVEEEKGWKKEFYLFWALILKLKIDFLIFQRLLEANH